MQSFCTHHDSLTTVRHCPKVYSPTFHSAWQGAMQRNQVSERTAMSTRDFFKKNQKIKEIRL